MIAQRPGSCDVMNIPSTQNFTPLTVFEKYDGGVFHLLQAKYPS
jgi:hypothetical protein